IIFYKKRLSDMHLVSQCDLRKDFDYLRSDMLKFSIASFCAELVYSVMPSEDAHPEVYELLLNLLDSLDRAGSPRKLLYNFSLKILSLSGFKPHLESCVICASPIKGQAYFSNRFGGLLCQRCRYKDSESDDILTGTIATILFLQKSDWQQSLRLNISPSIERQLSEILFSFLNFHLERKFKSLKMLNELLDHKIKMC
ncbi:MAG: DNA repair protein RecO, partial [Candidatus Omnitrophica bacterium]|nr:DNA repair protein RecO [Candidatus Omnitrophota bacterium]